MMQRILNSKNLVAFVLAAATGMTLYFVCPFPRAISFCGHGSGGRRVDLRS